MIAWRAGMVAVLLPLASAGGAQTKAPPAAPVPVPPVDTTITIMATPVAILIGAFDRDGDRIVSREEFDAGVAASFTFGDENRDGAISLIEQGHWAEIELGSQGALPGRFDFDRDGDNRISQAEFVAEFARRFAGFDKDKDGRITRAELLTLRFQQPEPGGRRRGR